MKALFNKMRSRVKDAPQEEAASWVAKHIRGLNDKEKQQFDAWINASAENEQAFFENQVTWYRMQEYQDPANSNQKQESILKRIYLPILAGAAAIVLFGFYGIYLSNDISTQSSLIYESYGFERELLVDGSSIELKPESKVEVRYNSDVREVSIEKGEVFFDVESDPERPFVVLSKFGSVTAIGTAFSVKVAEDLVEVWVVEGRVSVTTTDNYNEVLDTSGNDHEMIVNPGQMVLKEINNDIVHSKLMEVSQQEMDRQLTWKNDLIDFKSAPLYEILAEFNRRNSIKIMTDDDSLKRERLTVTIKPDNYESFIELISITLGLDVQYLDDYILLSRNFE